MANREELMAKRNDRIKSYKEKQNEILSFIELSDNDKRMMRRNYPGISELRFKEKIIRDKLCDALVDKYHELDDLILKDETRNIKALKKICE